MLPLESCGLSQSLNDALLKSHSDYLACTASHGCTDSGYFRRAGVRGNAGLGQP